MSSHLPSPEDTLKRVQSAMSSAKWTPLLPNDQYQHYRAIGVRSTRIQAMKPSPASLSVLYKGRLTADTEAKPIIVGSAMHRLSKEGEALMRELPMDQITHRSRPAGLMSSRLQLNELNRRVEKARQNKSMLDSISLPDSIAEEINSIRKDAILKRFDLDMDHIAKYAKEHELSSIAPGLKWGQLPLDRQFWEPIYQEVKGYAEEHMFSGESFNTPFNFGARARQDQSVEPGQTYYDLEVTRTRIVMFHPALSTMFAFLPDKKNAYREMIDGYKDTFELNQHIMTPLTDGGEVYGAAADALHNNEEVTIILGDDCNIFKDGKQYAYDGVNWETQVGTILGKPFYGTKTFFGGMHHVPSGVWDTSEQDTLATMWVLSQYGDDILKEGKNIPGIMERELEDEKVNFMLGLRYVDDPNQPRLQGLKLTQDTAKAAEILPAGRSLELTSKYDDMERIRWYLAYHGTTPDGGSLLDFLQKITAEDFKSGITTDYIMKGEEED